MPCGDVQAIPEEDNLWRRIKDHEDQLEWDADEDRWLPRTTNQQAIDFNPKMSAQWAEHLIEVHGLGPESVLPTDTLYTLVWEISVAEAGDGGRTVAHSPDGSEPIGCAHSDVELPPPGKKAERRAARMDMARSMRLVYGQPTIPPPPGA